tara:strand:+ start:168 stop:290 length:123 start_codon:yes stop_codon:yes gene_type:complete
MRERERERERDFAHRGRFPFLGEIMFWGKKVEEEKTKENE